MVIVTKKFSIVSLSINCIPGTVLSALPSFHSEDEKLGLRDLKGFPKVIQVVYGEGGI